jgi:hypothetical protein
VTQDRWCVLAFGPRLDRKASNAWAMRIPTLRTMKNAAITSNIDGPCAIDLLIKRSTFCTVKEIPPTGLNFPPHDDFEQHRAQRETKNGSTALLSFWEAISCPHANLNHSRPPAPPGRRHHRHPARPSRRVNPSRAGNSPTFTSLIMRRWNGAKRRVTMKIKLIRASNTVKEIEFAATLPPLEIQRLAVDLMFENFERSAFVTGLGAAQRLAGSFRTLRN